MLIIDQISATESLVTVECPVCCAEMVFKARTAGLELWLIGGALIQNALPELPPAERELLLSRICGDCFEKLFKQYDA